MAGGALCTVGLANALLAVWGLLGEEAVDAAFAGALLVAGVVTAAIGVLVWRGNHVVTLMALTAFALLLIVQVMGLATSTAPAAGAGPAAVLAALVVCLGLAAARGPTARGDGRG